MNREIKFRAWYRGRMYVNVDLSISPDYTKVEIIRKEGNIHTSPALAHLMQYTGLKDKNGKEIYEGDLVSIAGVKTAEVRWNPLRAKFGFWCDGDNEYNPLFSDEYEVFTNIYENPELLTK